MNLRIEVQATSRIPVTKKIHPMEKNRGKGCDVDREMQIVQQSVGVGGGGVRATVTRQTTADTQQ
jgi:hypothetical protein